MRREQRFTSGCVCRFSVERRGFRQSATKGWRVKMKLSNFLGLAGMVALAAGCNGSIVGGVSNPNPGATGGGGTGAVPPINPGTVTVPPTPFEPVAAQSSVRKVKNLLTGLPPTDADVATVTAMGAAGLQVLLPQQLSTDRLQRRGGFQASAFDQRRI
jgi:hypothetical protein